MFDQVEQTLKKRIDDFFLGIKKYNKNLAWSRITARRIINSELSKLFPERGGWIEQRYNEDHLFIKLQAQDPSGRIQELTPCINDAIFLRQTPEKYPQSHYTEHKVIGFEACLRTTVVTPISKDVFERIWENINLEALTKEVFLSLWKDTPKLEKLGNEILRIIRGT